MFITCKLHLHYVETESDQRAGSVKNSDGWRSIVDKTETERMLYIENISKPVEVLNVNQAQTFLKKFRNSNSPSSPARAGQHY
jgi:hypothetical protein